MVCEVKSPRQMNGSIGDQDFKHVRQDE